MAEREPVRDPVRPELILFGIVAVLLVVVGLVVAWVNGWGWMAWVLTGCAVAVVVAIPVALWGGLAGAALGFKEHGRQAAAWLSVPVDHPHRHQLIEDIIHGELEAKRIAAVAPGSVVPHSLSLSYRNSQKIEGGPAASQVAPLLPVPSFEESMKLPYVLLGAGVPDGQHVIEHEVMKGQQLPALIAGGTGTGKTSFALLNMAKRSADGNDVWLIDPDSGNGDSLTNRAERAGIHIPKDRQASEPDEIVALLRRFRQLFEWRRDGTDARGVDLFWDEFPASLDMLPAASRGGVADFLKTLLWRGRKRGVSVRLMGQNWLSESAGESSAIRDAIPISVVFATTLADASRATGLKTDRLPADLPELPTGRAYVFGRGERPKLIQVPPMLPAPSRSQIPTSGATSGATSGPLRVIDLEVAAEGGAVGEEVAGEVAPELRSRVITLIRAGQLGDTAITRDVFGVDGGRAFIAAAAKVRAIRTAYIADMERRLAELGDEGVMP